MASSELKGGSKKKLSKNVIILHILKSFLDKYDVFSPEDPFKGQGSFFSSQPFPPRIQGRKNTRSSLAKQASTLLTSSQEETSTGRVEKNCFHYKKELGII